MKKGGTHRVGLSKSSQGAPRQASPPGHPVRQGRALGRPNRTGSFPWRAGLDKGAQPTGLYPAEHPEERVQGLPGGLGLPSRGRDEDHGYLGLWERSGKGAPVDALPSFTCPGDPESASVAFLGLCGRGLRAKVAAWKPRACRGTVLVVCKENIKDRTILIFGAEDPVSVAAVVDARAGPS